MARDWGQASSAELVEVLSAVACELAERPAPGSAAVCMEEAEELGRATDLLEVAIAGRVSVVDRSGLPQSWGHTSTTAWLRTGLGMRGGRAQERRTMATQLPRLPEVARRVKTGKLPHDYAAVIVSAVTKLSDDDCPKAEAILLGLVDAGCSLSELSVVAQRIRDVIAERDGQEAPPEDARRGRRSWFRLSASSDGAFCRGWFDPELKALIKAKLGPLARPAGADDPRDHAERMADALAAVLSGGNGGFDPILIIELKAQGVPTQGRRAGAGNPASNGTRGPSSGSVPTSLRDNRSPMDPSDPGPSGPGPSDPCSFDGDRFRARLADGVPISPQRARQLLLTAGFSSLFLGTDGHPLYLARRSRFATPHQRRVLTARYRTCVVQDCEIPAELCEIDHVKGWFPDGTTDIDRLVVCCSFHNRWKAEHPNLVDITLRPDGLYRYRIVRPELRY